jgi:cytochrome P450
MGKSSADEAATPVPATCPVHAEDFDWPSPETIECPFPYLEALREEAPVYRYPDRNEYIVTRWNDIVEVARRTDVFSSTVTPDADPQFYKSLKATDDLDRGDGRFTPFSMAHSDPPEHREKRSLGLRILNQRTFDEQMIADTANQLVDAWIDRGWCDFRDEFSDWLPVSVIVSILGLDADKVPMYKAWSEAEGAGARYSTPDELRHEEEFRHRAAAEWQRVLLDRYRRPRADGFSELVRVQVERDGQLDLDYLVKEAEVLVFAGNVTTAHMLASAMVFLATDPALLARVREDRTLIRPLLEETLRLESPVQWLHRWAKADADIGGVTIPAGSGVILMWNSGNRDPRRWESADAFDIDRPDITKHHLAFGHGAHRCLGAPLARLEGEIAIGILLDRLGDIEIDAARSDLTHILSPHFRAPKRVVLRFTPRDTDTAAARFLSRRDPCFRCRPRS